MAKLKLRTYQCGSPRKRGEGLRIGAVRYPPQGIKKKDYAKFDYFDIWFPSVAPSRKLIASGGTWKTFVKRYKSEMNKTAEKRQAIRLLAEMAKKIPIAIGCYCEDESRCHRSILKKLIEQASKSR